ncbi:hypothetical protein; putative signal peptide [Frankia alni ACN14a]|uniref:Uncharacterized protein n=1 Tax=Frankia alni (strain DSM 45986 / CECT 9034 / ACN14a) TaxID=326424 RepID=Q0RS66_FRAAA|nr:hypothetical protein; putative signal peptide [Frankia alni ACN14a]
MGATGSRPGCLPLRAAPLASATMVTYPHHTTPTPARFPPGSGFPHTRPTLPSPVPAVAVAVAGWRAAAARGLPYGRSLPPSPRRAGWDDQSPDENVDP